MQASYEKYSISDYIGKKFGHLTVIGQAPKTNRCSNTFEFQCDCGNIIREQPARVINGHKVSCGKCKLKNKPLKPKFNIEDYIGKKSHMLTVIGLADRTPNDDKWYLKCSCECGNVTKVTPSQFNRGVVKSCGCLKSLGYRTIDNRTKHPLYGTWRQMLSRCENPHNSKYQRYGGRGIKVCDEWHQFSNFVKWSDSIGGRPEKYTLDRINNDGNYEPSNCRWATRFQQATNKSSNVVLEYNGESKTLIEWSISIGISWNTLWNRLKRGWSVEDILTRPVKNNKPHNHIPN